MEQPFQCMAIPYARSRPSRLASDITLVTVLYMGSLSDRHCYVR